MGFDNTDAYIAVTNHEQRIQRLEAIVAQLIENEQKEEPKKKKEAEEDEEEHITEPNKTIQNIADKKTKIKRL